MIDDSEASWLETPLDRPPGRSCHQTLTRCRSRSPATSKIEVSATTVSSHQSHSIDTKNPAEAPDQFCLQKKSEKLMENITQEVPMMKYIKKQNLLNLKLNETIAKGHRYLRYLRRRYSESHNLDQKLYSLLDSDHLVSF